MHPEGRRRRLLQIIAAQPMTSVDVLAARLGVSETTIRRDLNTFRSVAPPEPEPTITPCDVCGETPCAFTCASQWAALGLSYIGGPLADGRVAHSVWRIAAPGWGRIDDLGPLAKGFGATDAEARHALAESLCRVAEAAEQAARRAAPVERRRCPRCDVRRLVVVGIGPTCPGAECGGDL